MGNKVKICEICKQPFVPVKGYQIYCSVKCRSKAQYERNRDVYPVYNEQKKKEKRKSQVAEINRLAREAGMSYGKYTAKIFLEEQRKKSM